MAVFVEGEGEAAAGSHPDVDEVLVVDSGGFDADGEGVVAEVGGLVVAVDFGGVGGVFFQII